MFRAFLAAVGIWVLHEVCLGVGRGCGATFGYKRYRRIFAVGVEEEMGEGGAEECAVYTTVTARGGCVDVVAVGAVKLDCVHTGHV
jgi:hypothetical protein